MNQNPLDQTPDQTPTPKTRSSILTATDEKIARESAERLRAALQGEVEEIDAERSGRLSPPHTPGRGR